MQAKSTTFEFSHHFSVSQVVASPIDPHCKFALYRFVPGNAQQPVGCVIAYFVVFHCPIRIEFGSVLVLRVHCDKLENVLAP